MQGIKTTMIYILIFSLLIFMWFPIGWVILSSIKSQTEMFSFPPSFFFSPDFSSYIRMWHNAEIKQSLINSINISLASTFIALIIGFPASYVLARRRSTITFCTGLGMLLTRMLPRFSIVLPFYIIAISLGLFDTWILLTVVYLSFNLPFTVWLLKGYIEELPVSVEEAALIDGCSSWKLFSSILLPLTRPMVIAVAVINFVFSWNEFFFAFILTSRRARTLQVMIPALAGTMDMDWPMMTAISSLTMIVPLLLVTLVQRHIVRGLTLGAIR